MRFEITVMRAEGKDSPLVMMDRCTIDAASTADAARQYAALFDINPAGYHAGPHDQCEACANEGISRFEHDEVLRMAASLRGDKP